MRSSLLTIILLGGAIALMPLFTKLQAQPTQPAAPFSVAITIDAKQTVGPLKPIYRFFGADEPNYATEKNGSKLIKELGEMRPKDTYFRAHNLLVTGDGKPALKWGSTNAYTEDAQGNPVYDWKILDEIFDTYLRNGVRPYAQIGFMPKAMSIHPDPYQHDWKPGDNYNRIYTGWTYPPKSYDKWRELVYQWVKHCVDKYGKEEVEHWYWEVWNEANGGYWRGQDFVRKEGETDAQARTRGDNERAEEFRKLHDYAIDGVRKALPTAKVGGPDAAGTGGQWTRDFLEHCLRGTNYATGKVGTPIDFISFHAKGSPSMFEGHARLGIANQLRTIDQGFAIVASYPELKDKPIVIGESDPDGCAACDAAVYPQNAYRYGSPYASYTAASFGREQELAERRGVNLDGALTWAFEFEDEPFFAGFRTLATNGIDKAVMNVFRMMSQMSGQRLTVSSSGAVSMDNIMARGVRETPDVYGLSSIDDHKLTAMVWHYHDDLIPGPDANVTVELKNLPASGAMKLTEYRIDDEHSNSYEVWKKMGQPKQPTPEQYSTLEKAGKLEMLGEPKTITATNGAASISIKLPRQGISLLVLSW